MDEHKIKEAIKKSAALCSKKEMCEFDIRRKCKLWGLDEDESDVVLAYLYKEKFIDERRYTEFYCNDKIKFNRWGKIKVKHHLRAKFINSALIDKVLSEFDYDEYYTIAEELLKAKLRSVKYKDRYELKSKLMNFAASRGFGYDISNDIIDEVIKSVDDL